MRMGSKNSRSKNIRAPKYQSFYEEFKFLIQIFHTQFSKQSMFEASETLQKPKGTKKIKTTLFHWYSWNSELETTWNSWIGWRHRTSNTYVFLIFVFFYHKCAQFWTPSLVTLQPILRYSPPIDFHVLKCFLSLRNN